MLTICNYDLLLGKSAQLQTSTAITLHIIIAQQTTENQ